MKLQQVTTVSLATVAIIAPAQAQQSSVTVDGKNYSVNEMPGRTQHMVQLSGPEGMAMIAVNNQGKITMYASPAGGGTPDQRPSSIRSGMPTRLKRTEARRHPISRKPAMRMIRTRLAGSNRLTQLQLWLLPRRASAAPDRVVPPENERSN